MCAREVAAYQRNRNRVKRLRSNTTRARRLIARIQEGDAPAWMIHEVARRVAYMERDAK